MAHPPDFFDFSHEVFGSKEVVSAWVLFCTLYMYDQMSKVVQFGAHFPKTRTGSHGVICQCLIRQQKSVPQRHALRGLVRSQMHISAVKRKYKIIHRPQHCSSKFLLLRRIRQPVDLVSLISNNVSCIFCLLSMFAFHVLGLWCFIQRIKQAMFFM